VRQHAQFGVPSVEKLLGALPVVADYCSRLKIRSIVDGLCPVDDQADLTYGQVIEALVANRLTSPAPLVHVQSWAVDWAVGEAFSVEPALLSDDRIGRALDAIAPVLDQIAGSVGAAAIEAFGIDVSRIHWDLTSMSVHGDYEGQSAGFPAVKFGHPKDRRTDLKQIQTGLGVSGDGAVPVFHRAFDGGAGEVAQVIPVMRALQEMAGERRLLIIGDSKLISYANLAAMDGDGVRFVAPASKTYVSAADLSGLALHAATEVAYIAGRDAGKPADRRGTWHVVEDTMSVTGPRKADPADQGTGDGGVGGRAGIGEQRPDPPQRPVRDAGAPAVGRLERGLGTRHYPTVQKLDARLAAISRERRVGDYLRTATGTDPDTGKPVLAWSFDADAIALEAAGDGWYALLTNLDADEHDAAAVLVLKARKQWNAATPRSKDPSP